MKNMILETVSVTPRDLLLLQGLYELTVMSFRQIYERYFAGKSISTASNRLSRLEKGGLVLSFKVPKFTGAVNKPGVTVVFQITKDGIRELQKRNFDEVLRDEPVRLHHYSIDHDVLLVDVMAALKTKFPGSEMVHGKLLNGGLVASGINPDAIIKLPDGKTKYAVELELTLKAESRYREIVLKYRLARDISQIIYVTSHPAVREKLVKVIGGTPNTLGGEPVTGKFFFVNLASLLNEPERALITNGNDFLSQKGCL